jgi:lysozyme
MKLADLAKAEPTIAFGIDISSYQGKNSTNVWEKAEEAGLSFCYCKATEGMTIQDSQFRNNYLTLKDSYVPCGAYHFFRGGHTGTEQADNFLKQVADIFDTQDLPPTIDVEALYEKVSVETQIGYILEFCEKVKTELSVYPMIYTSLRVVRDLFKNTEEFGSADLSLWTVDYRPKITEPRLPPGFENWKLWQFSDKCECPGFRNPIDVDRFNGGVDELNKFIIDSHF